MNAIAEVTRIIAEKAGRPVDEITPDAKLEELGLQSLDAIDIMFDIEETLDIQLPDDADGGVPELRTVGDVISIVEGVVKT